MRYCICNRVAATIGYLCGTKQYYSLNVNKLITEGIWHTITITGITITTR